MADRKSDDTGKRYRVSVTGVVQGVGFRPFVYRLANKYHLTGFVKNEGAEVTIEIQGNIEKIEQFYTEVIREKPFASTIITSKKECIAMKGQEENFVILDSDQQKSLFNYISPDLGICNKCQEELEAYENRRFQYPFINCTDCGPRFSIIKRLPYDRTQTTMDCFELCNECKKEYESPDNRRFHAEATCCEVCGPEVWICDQQGNRRPFSISFIKGKLLEGKIIALKGIGGFHLLCNAQDADAVALLRKRKHRDKKPFALMAKNLSIVKQYCTISNDEAQILESAVKPILLLNKKERNLEYISETNTLGMMLPYTPLHVLLFGESLELLVATSGNIANEPICYENKEALHKLGSIADYFIMHDREILRPIDDSIMRVQDAQSYVIRRARGLVPKQIDFSFLFDGKIPKNFTSRSILAVGAEQKNTFCLTKGSYAIMSEHIGDLTSYETMQSFLKLKEQFKSLFDIRPEVVVADRHPEYLSSYMARKQPLKVKSIQHHHAHIAACMVENKIHTKVIGIAFDGTGYGDDGQIWGGEFFICDLNGYERIAHFEYIPMPGGEKCIREPWRMAKAYLYKYGLFQPGNKEEEQIYMQLKKGIYCPLTSSVGRLFDAVSAMLGLCESSEYEAQAAILLEMCCENGNEEKGEYSYHLIKGDVLTISCELVIHGIVEDLRNNTSKEKIAIKFHRTLARIMVDICSRVRRETGIVEVALGGGVFQNMYLAQLAESMLKKEGFHVFRNHEIPTNDGGISIGQAAIIYQEEQNVPFSSRKD